MFLSLSRAYREDGGKGGGLWNRGLISACVFILRVSNFKKIQSYFYFLFLDSVARLLEEGNSVFFFF